jgi:hypothetical protein
MTIPFESGQFVWSRFPFHEKPNDPGPIEHIVYIAGIYPIRGRPHVTAVSIYTTTRPVRAGEAVPIGMIPVTEDLARRMNQKPFVINARRIGFLPITPAFFPRLVMPGHGIVHRLAETAKLRSQISAELKRLSQRPDLMEHLGPDRPA